MEKLNLGHWIYNGPEVDILKMIGFVYVITNKLIDKKYIGKKLIISNRKKSLRKGYKNRKHKVIETDWKFYCGSSKQLNEDIIKNGKENFTFEILYWCNSKWMMAYLELKEQILRDVLFKDDYYNSYIGCRLKKLKNSI